MKDLRAEKKRGQGRSAAARRQGAHQPIRTLQGSAGNRAVASLIQAYLQRKKETVKTPASAWEVFGESAVTPWRKAIGFVREKRIAKADKEMNKTFMTLRQLGLRLRESDPDLGSRFYQMAGQLQVIGRQLRPKPEPIVDQMQELHDQFMEPTQEELLFAERK